MTSSCIFTGHRRSPLAIPKICVRSPIGNQLVDTKIQLDLATFAAPI
ncbi:MAG: hypothetical protein HC833_14255 [Leptolyngbyaceae cyanobacterium RM1_406_9]|nr:hypothetical protein [Leptolyngbyaceae cyanobacterium RM1_406_9]